MLPTKFLHIQDSLNELMHLKKRRTRFTLPGAGEEKERRQEPFKKKLNIFPI